MLSKQLDWKAAVIEEGIADSENVNNGGAYGSDLGSSSRSPYPFPVDPLVRGRREQLACDMTGNLILVN